MGDRTPEKSSDSLRTAIESVADQLCAAVDGKFDFRVKVPSSDPSIEKLQMLVNFVLDAARRSIVQQQILNDELRVAMLQLEYSCEKAEAANQAKSDFLANMSHELRTPLTAILGFTDVLNESANDDQRETLDIIHRNGTQLLYIVNDVLDLAKVEMGTVHLMSGEFEIAPFLSDITKVFAIQAQRKDIDLTFYTRTSIPRTISTDMLRVRQIMNNLIGNAIKFTAQGWVRVQASFNPAPENFLQIDVIDNGVGMPSNAGDHIFEPFSQVDGSVTREFGGAGLGLTISRRFARLLEGDVELVSTKRGMGSHFRLRLPCPVTSTTEFVEVRCTESHATRKQHSPALSPDNKPLSNLAVLLVEDGIDNQRLIKHILAKQGAEVTTADNGQLAVEAFQKALAIDNPFNLVLMDMQMPVMDGYTATRVLRDMGFQTPIIALTAHAMAGDREKCLNVGCTDYATKPINPKNLVELIVTTAMPQSATTLT